MPDQSAVNYLEPLRLGEDEYRELRVLAEELRRNEPNTSASQRQHERVIPDPDFKLLLELRFPNSSRGFYRIRPKDLSEGGLGFFHKAFVHPTSTCLFTGRSIDNHRTTISGQVVRCQHLRGSVHEVGVKFDHAIDLSKFVSRFARRADGTDPNAACLHSRVAALARELRELSVAHADHAVLMQKALQILTEVSAGSADAAA
jgi:PilZ domain